MDSSSIQLKGSEIDKIEVDGSKATISFSRAIIIKTMTGSVEKTKWWQAGQLVFEEVESSELPDAPLVCAGGDVGENVYTYRDMIPVPLESRGHAHCDLYFEGVDEHLKISAGAVRNISSTSVRNSRKNQAVRSALASAISSLASSSNLRLILGVNCERPRRLNEGTASIAGEPAMSSVPIKLCNWAMITISV